MKWVFRMVKCITGAILLASCATNDPIPINPGRTVDLGEEFNYMLFTRSGSSSNGFITGFDEFPPATVDAPALPTTIAYPAISGGVAFQDYVVNQQKLFSGPGYQKVTLLDGFQPSDGSIIETFRGGSSVVFASASRGYYVDFNTTNIQVFNPSTFNRTGEIDMSEAMTIPENGANYYNDLYIRGDKMFACLYTGLTFPPFVYQNEGGSILAVIDLNTGTFEKNIIIPGTKYAGQPFMRFKSNTVDEEGNLYIPTQGGLGLEGPDEFTPAKIVRVLAGADEMDTSYEFIPQYAIEGAANTPVINAGFLYVRDGIAYTNVLMEEPSNGADLVNLPLMRWAKLDLVNKTAELVEGIPMNAGLTAGMAYNYNDKVQLTVYNSVEGINAIYETDPATNTAEKRIDVVAGGIIYGLYEILETN